MKERLLTKSRFKLATECPTKLYYTGKEKYVNTSLDDEFLKSLAEGGFQVGELAKRYYPSGFDIRDKGYEEPLRKTNELLQKPNVVIFEAAIKFEDLFIRIDILEKVGNKLRLIEVKAKSFDGENYTSFLNKNGSIKPSWSPYLMDVTFQKYVLQSVFPDTEIESFLMLADKNSKTSINGLNQKFLINKDRNDKPVIEIKGDISTPALGDKILKEIQVDAIIDQIYKDQDPLGFDESFIQSIDRFSKAYKEDKKILSPIGVKCRDCEFKAKENINGSGFHECWLNETNLSIEELKKPLVLDLWNYRGKQQLINQNILLLSDVTKEHLPPSKSGGYGALSNAERQWLQVSKVKNDDDTVYLDTGLFFVKKQEFDYPLHFIDFETSMVALPFHKGRRPYEQIAFQYSHHTMDENGRIVHQSQYLNTDIAKFPNYDFIRNLKEDLSNDNGTIFRYADHENTVMNQILDQLNEENFKNVPDKDELISFIKTITSNKKENHIGERSMVDMKKLVMDFHYDPLTNGSNSIKDVLPAVLSRSNELQEIYSKPIYGMSSEVKSLNFEQPIAWIEFDGDGNIINPYKLLPPLFTTIEKDEFDLIHSAEELAGGGAAMTAYAKMQFTEMSEFERNKIAEGLLRYCELDTLAMVIIYQYWEIELEKKVAQP